MVIRTQSVPVWQQPTVKRSVTVTPAPVEKKPVRRSVVLERGFDANLRNARLVITQPNRKGEPVSTGYDLHKVDSDWGEAYLLQKDGGEQYHVLIDNESNPNEVQHICDCADFTFRQRFCKHIKVCQVLREQGKII